MTEPTRRKRPHPAAVTRVLVAGAAAAGTIAMAGAMARPVGAPGDVSPAAATGATSASLVPVPDAGAPQAPVTRVVVVRRHHPAPSAGGASTAAASISSSSAPAAAPVARPAPAPRPAPRPAPATTTTRGS